jgi:hypothetical protein
LLTYLADVASISDSLPLTLTVEDEADASHGSVENILTAAALAESLNDEIFSPPGMARNEGQDESDEEVEINLVSLGNDAHAKVTPIDDLQEGSQDTGTCNPEKATTTNPMEPNPSCFETDVLVDDHIPRFTIPDTVAPQKDDEIGMDDLISYSEVDDLSTADELHDLTQKAEIQSQQGPTISDEPSLSDEISRDTNVVPTPRETVGLDEQGNFTAPEIAFCQDQPSTTDTESLDNPVLFTFCPENQAKSPSKRSSSDSYPETVRPPSPALTPSTAPRNVKPPRNCPTQPVSIFSANGPPVSAQGKSVTISDEGISFLPCNPFWTNFPRRRGHVVHRCWFRCRRLRR